MLKIALTGGIGSGKSTVAKLFADLGVDVIDADSIAHQLVTSGKPALKLIVDHFGTKFLDKNGKLDRKQLRELIFHDAKQKKWLEQLLHPLIYQEMEKRINKVKSPYCILVIPLLFETACPKFVDRVLVIDTKEELQIQRIIKRDKLPIEEINLIISAQASRETRLQQADDIIINNGSLANLKEQVKKLHQKYIDTSR